MPIKHETVNNVTTQENIERGQIYLDTQKDEPYMVVKTTAGEYSLVSLHTGNRWADPGRKNNLFGTAKKGRFVHVIDGEIIIKV